MAGLNAGTHAAARRPTHFFAKRARGEASGTRVTKSGRPPCTTRESACQSRQFDSVTERRRGTSGPRADATSRIVSLKPIHASPSAEAPIRQ